MKTFKYLLTVLFIVLINVTANSQFVYRWVTIPSGTGNNLRHVNNRFIAGENGTFLNSPSGNATQWQPLSLGTSLNLNHVYVGSINFVAGNNQVIYRSTNTGSNWSQVYTGTSGKINGIHLSGPSTYTGVGALNGQIIKSTNNGLNWAYENIPVTEELNMIQLAGKM